MCKTRARKRRKEETSSAPSTSSKCSWNCNYRRSFFVQCTTRGRDRKLFYVHEATFPTPESLISYIIFLCWQFLLSLVLQFSPELQQVVFDVHFHTFISFPSSTELSMCREKKEHENIPSSFSSSSAFKFSCQKCFYNAVSIGARCMLHPQARDSISRVEWRFFSGW